ncbi:hypothetical protein ACFE04_028927 [Oxalis oulophora]
MILTILGELVFMALVVVIILHFVNGTKARSMVVGTICLVFYVIMYAAPLAVMIPNALGTLSGLVQLILFATYYRTTKWDEEPKPVEFELEDGTHLPPAGTLNAA